MSEIWINQATTAIMNMIKNGLVSEDNVRYTLEQYWINYLSVSLPKQKIVTRCPNCDSEVELWRG